MENQFCWAANLLAGAAGLLNRERNVGCPGMVALGMVTLGNVLRMSAEYDIGLGAALPDWVDAIAKGAIIPTVALALPVVLYLGGRRLAASLR